MEKSSSLLSSRPAVDLDRKLNDRLTKLDPKRPSSGDQKAFVVEYRVIAV